MKLHAVIPPPAFLLLAALSLTNCSSRDNSTWQGYVEGEYLHLGAPVAGLLLKRYVNRGDSVRAGDSLYLLEGEAERASVAEAERRLAQAQAAYENLLKGRRPTELATLEAHVEQNKAALELSDAEFARRQDLFRQQVVSQAELDQIRSQRDAARAALDSATAELATARLGGREDEIRAADADRAAAQAALDRARWSLDQKTQRSPAAGIVHDTLYQPGEFVPAGAPVIALLPPENVKVRFFVPQDRLSAVAPGTPVTVSHDGGARRWTARVNYVATQPEFTPPVIYSRETRAKLVFMVEASLPADAASQLRPGQPVDVGFGNAEPTAP
jgi:HlyD family secretion protein